MSTALRLALISLLVVLFASCDSARVDSINLTAEGMEAYKSGQTSKALESFRKAVEVYPENDMAHYRLGMIYNGSMHDYPKAIESFKKTVELKPEVGEYWYFLGYAQINLADKIRKDGALEEALKHYAGAQQSLEKAVELDEYYAEAWLRLARIYVLQGELSKAIDAYMNCIQSDPSLRTEPKGTAVAYLELASIYSEYAFLDESAQVLTNGIANNMEDIRLESELGNVYQEMKRHVEAIQHFERAYLIREETKAPIDLVLPALFGLGISYAALADEAMKKKNLGDGLKNTQSAIHWLELFIANATGDLTAQKNAANGQLYDSRAALKDLEAGNLPQYILDQEAMNAPKPTP